MKVHRIALATAALFVAALSTTVLVGGLTDSIAGESGKTEASDTEAIVAPRPIDVEGPVYPTDARENGIEGRVLLRVEVLETGRVGTVEAIEEVEGYPSMTKSAIDAVEGWTFEPSSKGGKAITLTVMIPIQYRLDPEAENPKSK